MAVPVVPIFWLARVKKKKIYVNILPCLHYKISSILQSGPKKTAQSLWHHNFATVHHRVKRFSAKCSERNSLHDLSHCLNTAVKYSLF